MAKTLLAPESVSLPVVLRRGRNLDRAGRATPAQRVWWPLLLVLALCPATILFAQQQRSKDSPEAKWEVLERCRLVTNALVDGDSFRVLHRDREYIFRLYFVDAPEGDATLTERAKDQAAYFGISPADIPRAAKPASQFTRDTLSGGEFTVLTRWQNAMGRSRLARFYAVVLVNGKNLAGELVAHGHARIQGLRANLPDGTRSTTFINQLKNLELTAREQKRGVWDESKFPRGTGQPSAGGTPANPPATTAPVDLNRASFEDLQRLPGIGPKLAERILAHRPYRKVEDLARVPGIGPGLLQRLKPWVQAGSLPP